MQTNFTGQLYCMSEIVDRLMSFEVLAKYFQDIETSRLQKRFLHLVSQAGEQHVADCLNESLPTPERSDVYHPAKKFLDLVYVTYVECMMST